MQMKADTSNENGFSEWTIPLGVKYMKNTCQWKGILL